MGRVSLSERSDEEGLAMARVRAILPPTSVPLVLLLVWQGLVLGFDVPKGIFPSLGNVIDILVSSYQVLVTDAYVTFVKEVLFGFTFGLAGGFAAGVAIAYSGFLQRGFLPLAAAFGAVPIVGLAPVLGRAFGVDWESKAAVVVIITFFPVVLNTVAGLTEVDQLKLELLRAYGANRWDVILQTPAAERPAVRIQRPQAGGGTVGDQRDRGRIPDPGTTRRTGATHQPLRPSGGLRRGVRRHLSVQSHFDPDVRIAVGARAVADRLAPDPFARKIPSVQQRGHASNSPAAPRHRPTHRYSTTQGGNVKRLAVLIAALLLSAGLAQDDLVDVVFQSKWFPQSQFAGYFVAIDQGYYAEEGLNVMVLDGGNVNPTVQVATGNADFGTDWIANMLVQREQGLEVVQIAQVFQTPGYRMVALSDSDIETFDDLAGTTVGVWGFGNEFVSQAVFAALGFTSDLDATAANPDVNAMVYAFDPSLVFPNEVGVASAMTYNELDQIVGLGFPLEQLNVLDPADIDAALLEDLIFTTPELLASDDFKGSGFSGRNVAERFLRVTIRGWEYAVANQDEAVSIVLGSCGDTCAGSGSTQSPLIHQTWQMARIAELVSPVEGTMIGPIDRRTWDRSVELLRDVGLLADPVNLDDVVDTSVLTTIY